MKNLLLIAAFAILSRVASAQSNSFQTLKDTFAGTGEVFHFSVSGWMCRAALSMAGEHEFKDAIEDVRSMHIINIPKRNFRRNDLSVSGFKKILADDKFESLMHINDNGDKIEIYLQQNDNKKNLYFVLVDESSEVTAIEIKGHLDMNKLSKLREKNQPRTISYELR